MFHEVQHKHPKKPKQIHALVLKSCIEHLGRSIQGFKGLSKWTHHVARREAGIRPKDSTNAAVLDESQAGKVLKPWWNFRWIWYSTWNIIQYLDDRWYIIWCEQLIRICLQLSYIVFYFQMKFVSPKLSEFSGPSDLGRQIDHDFLPLDLQDIGSWFQPGWMDGWMASSCFIKKCCSLREVANPVVPNHYWFSY